MGVPASTRFFVVLGGMLFAALAAEGAGFRKISGPEGGPVLCAVASRTHQIVGTSIGVFRRPREGGSWEKAELSSLLPKTPINLLFAFGDTVVAGYEASNSLGFFSFDDGANWFPNSGSGLPAQGSYVLRYAGRSGVFMGKWNDTGMTRSRDFGKTWEAPFLEQHRPVSILEWQGSLLVSDNDRWPYLSDGGWLYRYQAETRLVTPMHDGIPCCGVRFFTDGSILMATHADDFYRYRAASQAWENVLPRTDDYSSANGLVGFAGDHVLAVEHAVDSAKLYVSRDQGGTWARVGGALPVASPTGVLGEGTWAYLFSARDGVARVDLETGAVASDNTGLRNNLLLSFALRGDTLTVYTGQAKGFFRSVDFDGTWKALERFPDAFSSARFCSVEDDIFIADMRDLARVRKDGKGFDVAPHQSEVFIARVAGGGGRAYLSASVSGTGSPERLYALRMDTLGLGKSLQLPSLPVQSLAAYGEQLLYRSGNRLFHSRDGGMTWSDSANPSQDPKDLYHAAGRFLVAGSDGLFAGDWEKGWARIPLPTGGGTFLAARDGRFLVASATALEYSADEGRHWSALESPLALSQLDRAEFSASRLCMNFLGAAGVYCSDLDGLPLSARGPAARRQGRKSAQGMGAFPTRFEWHAGGFRDAEGRQIRPPR